MLKSWIKGGGSYVEYRTDDARLTIEVMKRAEEKGATILTTVNQCISHMIIMKK